MQKDIDEAIIEFRRKIQARRASLMRVPRGDMVREDAAEILKDMDEFMDEFQTHMILIGLAMCSLQNKLDGL